MKPEFIVGESDMRDFTPWWKSHLPAYLMVYCREGAAQLSLLFRSYTLRKGTAAFVYPDMFPDFVSVSEDFRAFYCLIERDFAEECLYGVPGGFFDAPYIEPMLDMGSDMEAWVAMLDRAFKDVTNPYRQNIFADILHAAALDWYNNWLRQYGDYPVKNERTSAEDICIRFYDLIYDHILEHRSTAFYADKLCITPCYLAMVMRQVCGESPKQVIDRQVTLEIKNILRNTTMTAEQIANYLHFPDTSYLCRFFRKQTGQSMSEYRKESIPKRS